MRAVVQRVKSAKVLVEGEPVGDIAGGILVFLGVGEKDSEKEAEYLALKIAHLRIFPDEKGLMNLSIEDVGGSVLVVSQFTLWADCVKGRRPSFTRAAPPDRAKTLYEVFIRNMQGMGLRVASGTFQANMEVHLINDGPVTILLDTEKTF